MLQQECETNINQTVTVSESLLLHMGYLLKSVSKQLAFDEQVGLIEAVRQSVSCDSNI